MEVTAGRRRPVKALPLLNGRGRARRALLRSNSCTTSSTDGLTHGPRRCYKNMAHNVIAPAFAGLRIVDLSATTLR